MEVEYACRAVCLTCKKTRTRIGWDSTVAPRNYANRHSYQIQSRCALACNSRSEPPALAGARHGQEHSAMHNLRRPARETLSEFSKAAFV